MGFNRPLTDAWSILHISDTQFGQYHRFGDGQDSLASRLLTDLTQNLLSCVPPIRIILITGDITERALPDEYQQAMQFLVALTSKLGLHLDDVVVVPGNHDVSWKACEAHFNERESRGAPPLPPFRTKWKYYTAFQKKLDGSGHLYALINKPELNLSLIRLNSTVRESHLDHYGWCGEDQLEEMAASIKQDGLGLRFVLLHHNVRRGPTTDDENLRDEADLTRILGPHIDLVLHGHTHDGNCDRLSDGTLVLATGSAAVTLDHRPEEVPNQYQVLAISGMDLSRWARRYEPGQKRFVADSRIGTESQPGHESFELYSKRNADLKGNSSNETLSRLARQRLGMYGNEQSSSPSS